MGALQAVVPLYVTGWPGSGLAAPGWLASAARASLRHVVMPMLVVRCATGGHWVVSMEPSISSTTTVCVNTDGSPGPQVTVAAMLYCPHPIVQKETSRLAGRAATAVGPKALPPGPATSTETAESGTAPQLEVN